EFSGHRCAAGATPAPAVRSMVLLRRMTMKRYYAFGLCSALLLAGCVPTDAKAATQTNAATEASAAIEPGGCQTCVVDPRPLDKEARAIESSYLDQNNRLLPPAGPRWVPTPKRVRVYFAGQLIADSSNVHLLRES